MSTDSQEIAILTIEVRHLTEAVKKLLEDMDGQRDLISSKAAQTDVTQLQQDFIRIEERLKVLTIAQEGDVSKLSVIDTRLSKLEMETWKLGLMLGGAGTGGATLALGSQYIINLIGG